jgi:hypothetical protein
MSLTFDESLLQALRTFDNKSIVALLEPRVARGAATESEMLLCGVLLLLPPLADYEASAEIFKNMGSSTRRFEAAVWDAYRYETLLPVGPMWFQEIFSTNLDSAVCAHMLGKLAACSGDMVKAIEHNRRSRGARLFPFNIIGALRIDPEIREHERSHLLRCANDLIISRSAESDDAVVTVDGALQRRWDNLILGTRMTSQLCEQLEFDGLLLPKGV